MGKKSKGSSKFMNPTDKSRKDARRKELKKNKKQRLAVRQAVIKQKDPHQILAELERLDDIEFNVNDPPALNEKVIGDKRKKLNETWDRLIKLYAKEEKEKYGELKRLESEYERRRQEKRAYFESVRSARSVDLDEIPLPSMPGVEASILKKAPSLSTHYSKVEKEPPGPPPGPPPDLSDFEDEEEEGKKKVRFDAQPVCSNDVDEFLKEIEELPKVSPAPPLSLAIRPPGLVQAPVLNPNIRPPPVFPFPSDSAPNSSMAPNSSLAPNPSLAPNSSLAPSPGLLRPPSLPFVPRPRPPITTQKALLVLPKKEDKGKQSATIEAKPQLRNLSADATRFTPLALRVKRPENKSKKVTLSMSDRNFATSSSLNTNTPSTDDAYEQFMKEMEGML